MRGFLSFQILHLVSRKPMHGEELALELKIRRGEKPKAGTLYPALKYLSNKNLVRRIRKGRIVVYNITPDGRKSIKTATEYFVKCFGDVFEEMK